MNSSVAARTLRGSSEGNGPLSSEAGAKYQTPIGLNYRSLLTICAGRLSETKYRDDIQRSAHAEQEGNGEEKSGHDGRQKRRLISHDMYLT
jgi:hypothetical protein